MCGRVVNKNKTHEPGVVVHTLLISAFRGQKQADLCEFEASLIYRVSSRIARAT